MVNGDDFGDMDEEKKKRLEEEKIRRKEEREKKLDQLLNRSLVGSKMQVIATVSVDLGFRDFDLTSTVVRLSN